MRWVLALFVLTTSLAGCTGGDGSSSCFEGTRPFTFYFDEGYSLTADGVPSAGAAPGNGFVEAFLTNDITEWFSEPLEQGLVIVGNVTVEFHARNVGTPAPIILGGAPGEGYHFFNQFGSDRGFMPSYAIEYASVLPVPGSVDGYNETLQAPPGGFVLERNDRVRLLLTSLVLDGSDGSGHEILYGDGSPSRIRFEAACFDQPEWREIQRFDEPLSLFANQGLLTGAIPATEGLNRQTTAFELVPGTERLTIRMTQEDDLNPIKDDLDFTVLAADGTELWSGGSPYTDEVMTLHAGNLEALVPDGAFQVRVDSYSGIAYQGTLVVEMHGTA